MPVMLGKIDPNRRYAVFSSTSVRNAESLSLNFIFLLPLTALAWKRIGFDSIIIIAGSEDVWHSDPLLHLVLTCARELDAVVVFINVHPANAVMVSQASRIFAANILVKAATAGGSGGNCSLMDNIYLVTSDADLWPISSSAYDLPAGVDVLSLNSLCCGTFQHHSETYRMIPMANIGARISTWQKLTIRNGLSPSTGYDLIEYMETEFGDVAVQEVHKGENVGWHLDQRLITILVSDWRRQRGSDRVMLTPRNTDTDRIDRSRWNPAESIVNKIDAHLLNDAYKRSEWHRMTPLLAALHGETSQQFAWSLNYYKNFTRLRDVS